MATWLDGGVTYVSGSTFTGLYADNGTINVVESNPAVRRGVYHPCGAVWVTTVTGRPTEAYAPNGSVYLSSSTPGALPAGFGLSSLYHDYTTGRYVKAPAPSITRASTKTVFNNAGLMSTVASGALALSDRGLSIEESRQNPLNSDMSGGTPGVFGSGGSFPTGWQAAFAGGITATISYPTVNGMPVCRVRFTGVASNTVGQYIRFEAANVVAAGTQQCTSVYAALSAGSLGAINLELRNTSAQTGVTMLPLPPTLTRDIASQVVVGTDVQSCIRIAYPDTVTSFDWTLDLAVPQREAGATFATSPIIGPVGTTTRAADVITIPSPTSYVSLAQGGAFVEWQEDIGPVGSLNRTLIAFLVDGTNFIRVLINSAGNVLLSVSTGGATQVTLTSANPVVAGSRYKVAIRWGNNDCAIAFSPSLGTLLTDAVATMPSGAFVANVGNLNASQYLNDPLCVLAYFSTGPTNAELQALVA
jgi:hypothetical protein